MTSTTGRNNSRAFTLVELLLVLVIISAVLAISAPSLRGFFASRQTADTATTMLSLAKLARTESIAQGRPWRLNIDAASGEFWLTAQDYGTFATLNSSWGRRFRIPDGASISVDAQSASSKPEVSYVQFYPTGRTDVASVEITGRQGDVFIVANPSATEPFQVLSASEVR